MPNIGEDDRRKYSNDHDTLIRIITVLENHTKNFEDHVIADGSFFKEIREELKLLSKFMWVAIGGLSLLNLIPVLNNIINIFNK